MVVKRAVVCAKVAVPLLLGVCIGVALSLIVLPLMEEGYCGFVEKNNENIMNGIPPENFKGHEHFFKDVDMESFLRKEYEPRIIKPTVSGAQNVQKPVRYRFAASELDLKDTVLIAYVTSSQEMEGRALALNRVLTQAGDNTPPFMFFAERGTYRGDKVPAVLFDLIEPKTLPILTIQHLASHYKHKYKFFMIVPDTVFIKTDTLKRLLDGVQADDVPYVGIPSTSHAAYCDFERGVIISQPLLLKMDASQSECQRLFMYSGSFTEAMGQCIALVSKHHCSSSPLHIAFPLRDYPLPVRGDISSLGSLQEFKDATLVSGVVDPKVFYHLQRFTAKDEIAATMEKIDHIRKQLTDMFDSINETAPWPIGVPDRFATTNRYDLLRWTFIENNTAHLEWDYVNSEPLTGAYLLDHQNMIEAIMSEINSPTQRFKLLRHVQSYRRVDPTRGMEYIITLELHDILQNQDVVKNFELVKPLAAFEVLSQPFSSDTVLVNVLVTVAPKDVEPVKYLMETFVKAFVPEKNIVLNFVMEYWSEDSEDTSIDKYKSMKEAITQFETTYNHGDKIAWIVVRGKRGMAHFEKISQAAAQLSPDTIAVTMTVMTDINPAFVSHARVNAIKGEQVYAPIAFWQYKPELIYESTPYPTQVQISRNIGHFGEKYYDHLAFYVSDLIAAWSHPEAKALDRIVDAFLLGQHVEILRSADPDITVRYSEQNCSTVERSSERSECEVKRIDNVGSAAILAQHLINNGFQ